MKIKTAAVILPCLNEEKTARDVIKKIRIALHQMKIKCIIIAVDDASEDDTQSVLKSSADKVLILEQRKPLADVIRIGLKEAISFRTDVIIHIDSDGQYDPFEISKLLLPIKNNTADFTIGIRDIWHLNHMPFLKKAGNSFFTQLTSIIMNKKMSDTQSGYRAMSFQVATGLELKSGYTYTQEELVLINRAGFRVQEIPITFRERFHGKSRLITSKIRYGFYVLIDLHKMAFSR